MSRGWKIPLNGINHIIINHINVKAPIDNKRPVIKAPTPN